MAGGVGRVIGNPEAPSVVSWCEYLPGATSLTAEILFWFCASPCVHKGTRTSSLVRRDLFANEELCLTEKHVLNY